MNLKKTIILFLILLPCLVMGQEGSASNQENSQEPACGVDMMLKKARKSPVFRSREAEMNRRIMLTPVTLSADFTLPVVFHIIADDPTTVTDAEIMDALKDLNDAFAKTGKYAGSMGADTKIQFCMAKTDPSGGITNGITRTSSFFANDLNSSIEDARLKKLVYWDPLHYINIWYVKNIQNENFYFFTCGLVNGSQWRRIGTEGYAPMPALPLDSADGIVVSAFGPILAHEMGHYLGLYHTFEGGCGNNDCTLSGDKVCDTPPDNSYLPSSCTNPANTCNTDTLSNYSNGFFRKNVPDQVENFMDYGNWSCSNMFTNGQSQRMRATIVAFRKELLDSKCNPPCNENIVSSFTRDLPYPLPGQTVNFTNTGSGASNFEWYVDDTLLSTSPNFSYTVTDTGKYNIRLKAFNGNASCFSSTSDYVIVTCGVTARFFADKQHIASKIGFATDSILFTNTSVNGTAYKWMVSNNTGMSESVVSTTKDFLYTFKNPGDYKIRLVATNGGCTDTTLAFEANVADPTPDVRPVIYRADCYEQTKVKLEFGICNQGYTPIPPGAPVSFYDSDPRLPGAKKIGGTFLLPDSIYGSCCSSRFTEILDAKRKGLNQIYVSFNDNGTTVPVKYPAGGIIEKNYLNNVAVEKFFRYQASVDPASPTVLPGDSLRLTASALPEGTVSTYQWSPATGLSCTNCPNPIIVADSTRTFTVAAQSEYKCYDTTTVTVKVPPVYDYSISIESISCTSDKDSLLIDFTVYNSYRKPLLPKGLPVSFYNGNPVAGIVALLGPVFKLPNSVSNGQLSLKTKIKATKTGTIYGVVNDIGSTIPLKLPNTTFTEINYANNTSTKAYVPFTVTASNSGPVCENDSIQLKAASNIPGASFKWTGPAGFTSVEPDPLFKPNGQPGAGVYTVVAKINDCVSLPATTNVVLHTIPVVTATSSKPVCETGNLRLTATGDATNKYQWTGPASYVSASQNPTLNNLSAQQSGLYTVIATSINNCESNPASININVSPLPVADFIAADICMPNTTAQFKSQSKVAQGNITSFLWNFGDAASGAANIDSVANPPHAYTGYGKYLVTLRVITNNGCANTVGKLYSGIHLQPEAKFSSDHPAGICANEEIIFTDKSTGDDGTITSWIWQAGDGSAPLSFNNANNQFRHTYNAPGIYTVTLAVKNDFGCENQSVGQTTVFALPQVNAGPDQFVHEGRSATLFGTASADVTSIRWTPSTYLSDPTMLKPSVNFPTSDVIYYLNVTNDKGCKATDNTIVKILKPLQIPNVFSPNGDGINDVWNIRYLADYPGCIVDIFDRYGKQVFHSVGYNKPWDGTISGRPVPVGVYYYIITPKNETATINGSVTVLR